MELTLHPSANICRASGREFAEGDRVISYLVRETTGEFGRHDVLASEDAAYAKPDFVFCSWTVNYKSRRAGENPGRALKLTAENLFVTLGDPAAEPNPANTPLLQFLALLLERKRLLRPRGLTPDGERQVYEHARTHQRYEIPVGKLDAEFFLKIQGRLDLLMAPGQAVETAPAGVEPAPGNADSCTPA